MRSLADTVPVGMVVIDRAGLIVWCNSELQQQFRYRNSELIGQRMEVLLPERYRADQGGLRAGYASEAVAGALGKSRELFGRRQDGQEFPVEIGLRPLPGGDSTMFVATVLDISARRQAEASFHRVIEAAPCGMMMVDATRRITLVNEHLLQLFGYERAELVGQSLDLLIPARHRDQHALHVRDYVRDATTRAMGQGLELTGLHKDGSEFAVEIGLNPVQVESGTAVLATVIDVSGHKLVEQRLRRANADLEEFANVASHDLRSPLRGIADLVDWIAQDLGTDVPGTVLHNIDRMRVRTLRMETLIENLLHYAKAGIAATEAETVDVAHWLQEEIDLQTAPAHVHFKVTTQIMRISILKTPLSTVLRNIISNAIKHNDMNPGQIEIDVRSEGAFLGFTIRDNGPGIPEDSREQIFKLFQRLSTKREGSGMGLALVKRMVEAHGGMVSVGDRTDGLRGAQFRVLWPRRVRQGLR
ncbi:MAG TPA: PAS domain-containing sensor histidine kinase [Steroidobacteraceae bacterium]|nr:PAS domain-containing sensor histidine kinase [Steroidobacteraceae bacterium]